MNKIKNTVGESVVVTLVIALAFSVGRLVLIKMGIWA